MTASTLRLDTGCPHCARVHRQIEMTAEGGRSRGKGDGRSYVLLTGQCPVTGERLEVRWPFRETVSQVEARERKARWIAEGTYRGERSGVR